MNKARLKAQIVLVAQEREKIMIAQTNAMEVTASSLNRIENSYNMLVIDLLMEANDEEGTPPIFEGGDGEHSPYQVQILIACAASTLEDVVEPPDSDGSLISKRIRTSDGLGWSWEPEYTENGQFAWCGAEAAYVLAKVGLKYDIRYSNLASCYRLQEFCKNSPRVIDYSNSAPGDIVIWGNNDSPQHGSHITILISKEGDKWTLHEGNAVTSGPRMPGESVPPAREGAGTKFRTPMPNNNNDYRVFHVYRFLKEDFDISEGADFDAIMR